MIRNLIFDFGNVIVRYDSHALAAHYVNPADEAAFYAAVMHDWASLDRGDLDYETYIRDTKALLPASLHAAADAYFAGWYRQMPPIGGMEDLIKDAKEAGYRVFLLSNASVFLAGVLSYFPAIAHFDDVLISAVVHDEKPNASIYRTALAQFGAMPHESVFVDDRAENVDAASALGIHGVLFDGDAEKLRRVTFPRLGVFI